MVRNQWPGRGAFDVDAISGQSGWNSRDTADIGRCSRHRVDPWEGKSWPSSATLRTTRTDSRGRLTSGRSPEMLERATTVASRPPFDSRKTRGMMQSRSSPTLSPPRGHHQSGAGARDCRFEGAAGRTFQGQDQSCALESLTRNRAARDPFYELEKTTGLSPALRGINARNGWTQSIAIFIEQYSDSEKKANRDECRRHKSGVLTAGSASRHKGRSLSKRLTEENPPTWVVAP